MAHDPIDTTGLLDAFLAAIRPPLGESTRQRLRPLLQLLQCPARELLVRENQRSNKVYWILKGASRSYYVQNGLEIHTWFAFENELIGSLHNFNQLPSRTNISLVEDSTLIAFDIPGLQALMETDLEVTRFVHGAILDYALFMEDKMLALHMRSAREKYADLLAREPEIFQRVPLTYIASCLGISRETLSRLRAK